MKIINFLILSLIVASCAHRPKIAQKNESARQDLELSKTNLNQMEEASVPLNPPEIPEKNMGPVDSTTQKMIENIEGPKYIKDHIQNFSLKYFKNHFESWVQYLGNKDRERFLRHLENGKKYFPIVSKILKAEGMPQELFLVGLIESGYYTKARSHAAAVGPWQFIKGTATRYGLRVGRGVDDRSDIEKSTIAAAHYFKDLYNIFGSWELALCAYNAGEYRIIGAIRKGNSRDYLTLVRKGLLPPETVMYIPKVEAARTLINNYEKYNLPFITDSFKLQTNIEERKIASDDSQNSSQEDNEANFESRPLKRQAKKNLKIKRNAASSPLLVTQIRKGDRLDKIAEEYGVELDKIKKLNKMKKEKILAGQKLKIPVAKKSYVVRRGDNLNDIAKKHGVTVAAILRHNQLDSRKIYPKQKLIVPVATGEL